MKSTQKYKRYVSPYLRQDTVKAEDTEYTGTDPHMTYLVRKLNTLREKLALAQY